MSQVPSKQISVAITGAGGNLGQKMVASLTAADWCARIVAMDRQSAPADRLKVEWLQADLANPADARWRNALTGVDALVHLAAQNPAPDSSWTESCAAIDMTLHLLDAARQAGVRRFVFASSNHAMGQYKDPPLADGLAAGGLTTALPPGPGTRWFNGRAMVYGTAYGVSKVMGERACAAAARQSGGKMSTVSVRIGWCQPGENHPRTLNTSGVAGAPPIEDSDAERNLRWFRDMWLSNRDFASVIERAIRADAAGWPEPGIIINGMSANTGMPWSLEEGRRLIGYEPLDDVWKVLRA